MALFTSTFDTLACAIMVDSSGFGSRPTPKKFFNLPNRPKGTANHPKIMPPLEKNHVRLYAKNLNSGQTARQTARPSIPKAIPKDNTA